jgi:hypothetical protein
MSSLTPYGVVQSGLTLDHRSRRQLARFRSQQRLIQAQIRLQVATEAQLLQGAVSITAHAMAAEVVLTQYQQLYEGLCPLAIGRVGGVAEMGAIGIGHMAAEARERLSA